MKTPQTNDSLSKAIAYLGAVEVARDKYAIPRFEEPGFDLMTSAHLKHFAAASWEEGVTREAGYAQWVQDRKEYVRMPAWWSPDQRFATCNCGNGSGPTAYPWASEARSAIRTGKGHVITADLETGAEVPA